jgi:hypothetical protein
MYPKALKLIRWLSKAWVHASHREGSSVAACSASSRLSFVPLGIEIDGLLLDGGLSDGWCSTRGEGFMSQK